ncbi:MAG: hypothetical protein ABH846_02665 [Patescibacteria group bacterium]
MKYLIGIFFFVVIGLGLVTIGGLAYIFKEFGIKAQYVPEEEVVEAVLVEEEDLPPSIQYHALPSSPAAINEEENTTP